MFSHEPDGYTCPYCRFLAGKESDHNNRNDIVATNGSAFAFICPMAWIKNSGNVIVIPKKHYENIFSIPTKDLQAVTELVKRMSIAMRATYNCSGITLLQRNEPDAGQQVWHLHVHIVPRYTSDAFEDDKQTIFAEAATRAPFAQKLREYFQLHPTGESKEV